MVYGVLYLVCVVSVSAIFADLSESKLRQGREIFYSEIGCQKTEAGYACPDFRETFGNGKCLYNGREYEIGGQLIDDETSEYCRVGCKCTKHGKLARFECAQIDCAEVFAPPPAGDCITRYAAAKCCSTGTVCGDDLLQLDKCELEGDTYLEGQRMYTKVGCYTCNCVKGFDNGTAVEENANCRRQRCNILLNDVGDLYNGCAPIYYKNVCCPIEFRCRK